jgi:hypothetical protein
MAIVFACLAFLPMLVTGLPQVNYPLNMQHPPVARVGTPFSFQFAPTTFSSASGSLQYSPIGNPPWLSLDDNSRTLSGTPRARDVGTVNFTITAAEQAGAVADMQSISASGHTRRCANDEGGHLRPIVRGWRDVRARHSYSQAIEAL